MKNFKLIKKLVIKNVSLKIKPKNNCFLYHFKRAGLSRRELVDWLNGKLIEVYDFTGRFGKPRKCPWCDEEEYDNLEEHIKKHDTSIDDIHIIKLSQQAYRILLDFTRTGDYDTLMFFVHKECQYCIGPFSKDRQGKCELPESSRNKFRSLKSMGFKCDGLNIKSLPENSVAFIYRKKPIK